MRFQRSLALATLLSWPIMASADQVFNDNIVVTGTVCAGEDCVADLYYQFADISIQSGVPIIDLIDTDASGAGPNRDWRIETNQANALGEERFTIQDVTQGTYPFWVEPSAPTNALRIDTSGYIGLGTTNPLRAIHVVDGDSPGIRLQQDGSEGFPVQTWEMFANEFRFGIQNVTSGTIRPFTIENGAPADALFVADNGNVGVRTNSPDAPFELSSPKTFNFLRITASGAELNDSVDITFTGGPLGTGQLRYNIVDGDNQEMSLDADGNMVLDGTLTTAGPTCSGGCDRVFDADYALPSIEDHNAQMFTAGHLPAIGPTLPYAPVNISEKLGHVINELEHAHIYIGQLNTQISQLKARDAAREQQMQVLMAAFETLANYE